MDLRRIQSEPDQRCQWSARRRRSGRDRSGAVWFGRRESDLLNNFLPLASFAGASYGVHETGIVKAVCGQLDGNGDDINSLILDHREQIGEPALSTKGFSCFPCTLLVVCCHRREFKPGGPLIAGTCETFAQPLFAFAPTIPTQISFCIIAELPNLKVIAHLFAIQWNYGLLCLEIAKSLLLFADANL